MHTIYPLFSVPVYSSNINSLSAKHADCIANLKYRRTQGDYVNLSTDNYVLNLPELEEIKSQITNHINTYCYDILKTSKNIKFKLLNSWAAQYLPKDYCPPHSHINSLFSGVLYIKTSENCGNITFRSKLKDTFSETIGLNYEEYNIHNSTSWSFKPFDGLILLYPSYLAHDVSSNLSDDTRYCIAFNIFIEGDLGSSGDFKIDFLSIK